MRTTRRIIIASTACILLAGSLALGAEAQAKAGRNPQEFYGYLEAYSELNLDQTSRDEWSNYGDNVCRWLADQPYPWFSRADRFQHSGLEARYWRENPAPAEWSAFDFQQDPKFWLVPAAWGSLCPTLWQWHEPHNPFNKARSD